MGQTRKNSKIMKGGSEGALAELSMILQRNFKLKSTLLSTSVERPSSQRIEEYSNSSSGKYSKHGQHVIKIAFGLDR